MGEGGLTRIVGGDQGEATALGLLGDLLGHEHKLLKDIKSLDLLYGKTLNFYDELAFYIAAGEEKLREIGQATNKQFKAILTPEQWKSFLKARQALVKTPKVATPAANQPEAKKE